VSTNSIDEVYRPWLEKNVGREGIDWIWNLETDIDHGNRITAILYITLRRGKEKAATLLALSFNQS